MCLAQSMTLSEIFFEAGSELRRVTWPTRDQVANNTVVVLVTLAVFAIVIVGLDYAFGGGVVRLLRLGS